MEYALSDQIPFAGGLGVLAADYLLECGKQNFPLVAVGLGYHQPDVSLAKLDFHQHSTLQLPMGTGNLDLTVWRKDYSAVTKLFLLDAGSLTVVPYGPEYWTMVQQEIILGFGGVKLLKDLGVTPTLYHLNEGHTAFTLLALMKDRSTTTDLPVVATKHTILTQSGLHLSREDFRKALDFCWPDGDFDALFSLGSDENHPEFWSSNKFLIRFALRANGVSVKHCEVEKEVHKNSPLIPITNGINPDRWLASNIKSDASDAELWSAHDQNRKTLVDYVNTAVGSQLDPKILTLVWARRLAEYKQPELILNDINALSALNVQIVIAGHPNPKDSIQQSIAERLGAAAVNPKLRGRLVFLPHYDLEISKILTSGADVWLNTPIVGKEACGTSTMKAGLNGALALSTPDGWITQEDWSHGGGWLLDKDATANSLYSLLANQIVPVFYNRDETGLPKSWIGHMRLIMKMIATKYTTTRMLEEYCHKLYNLA